MPLLFGHLLIFKLFNWQVLIISYVTKGLMMTLSYMYIMYFDGVHPYFSLVHLAFPLTHFFTTSSLLLPCEWLHVHVHVNACACAHMLHPWRKCLSFLQSPLMPIDSQGGVCGWGWLMNPSSIPARMLISPSLHRLRAGDHICFGFKFTSAAVLPYSEDSILWHPTLLSLALGFFLFSLLWCSLSLGGVISMHFYH